MDINDKQVAERIRQLRKERKLTQQELADVMGCSRSVVSTLESGRQVRGIKRYVQIADYFQMTVDDLFGRNSEL